MPRPLIDLDQRLKAEALAYDTLEQWIEAEVIEDPDERGVATEKIQRESKTAGLMR